MNNKAFAVVSGALLLFAAMIIYWKGFPSLDNDDTRLSAIVLVGLRLTVVFIAILAIIYSVMGIENKDQALGLPERSVRALLAFSLVLIFVCLAAFLFSGVNKNTSSVGGRTLSRVTDAQLSDLKSNFVVASEASAEKGKLLYEQILDPSDKEGKSTIDRRS